MSNIKDTLTTIAGWLGGAGLALNLLASELAKVNIVIPDLVLTIGAICTAISVVVIGILNGKNADGSKKSVNQVSNQAAEK